MSESSGFIGPDALSEWRKTKESSGALDVVLVTHPRDENDIPRLFPWVASFLKASFMSD